MNTFPEGRDNPEGRHANRRVEMVVLTDEPVELPGSSSVFECGGRRYDPRRRIQVWVRRVVAVDQEVAVRDR